jgi:hypothetical protein
LERLELAACRHYPSVYTPTVYKTPTNTKTPTPTRTPHQPLHRDLRLRLPIPKQLQPTKTPTSHHYTGTFSHANKHQNTQAYQHCQQQQERLLQPLRRDLLPHRPTPKHQGQPIRHYSYSDNNIDAILATPTREILDGQLDLQVFCNSDLSATFIIRNISGSVSDGAYNLSDPSQSGSINLQPGGTISLKGAGYATMTVSYKTSFLSSVTLSTVGSCLLRPTSTPTNTPVSTPTNTPTSTPTNTPPAPPSLSATGVCTGINTGTATFVITNNGSDMPTPYTYNIADDKGTVVQTGTFQLPAGGSTILTINGISSTYTLSSPNDNNLTVVADMSLCVPPPPPPPALTVAGACTSNAGTATFVVTNNGGNMTNAYTYNVTDASGTIVDTNTFQLAAGASTTITVNGPSTSYTLSSPE